jgi:hypothetical protein
MCCNSLAAKTTSSNHNSLRSVLEAAEKEKKYQSTLIELWCFWWGRGVFQPMMSPLVWQLLPAPCISSRDPLQLRL